MQHCYNACALDSSSVQISLALEDCEDGSQDTFDVPDEMLNFVRGVFPMYASFASRTEAIPFTDVPQIGPR
jgi:hypothetical protein